MSKMGGYVWFGCGIVTASSASNSIFLIMGLFMLIVGARTLGEY